MQSDGEFHSVQVAVLIYVSQLPDSAQHLGVQPGIQKDGTNLRTGKLSLQRIQRIEDRVVFGLNKFFFF